MIRVCRVKDMIRIMVSSRTEISQREKLTNCIQRCLGVQVTKLLLVVSMVFLLSNTPSHVVRVYLFAMSQLHTNYRPGYPFLITQNFLQHLFYANFATNFVLYNASGRTFRRAMVHCGRSCIRGLTTSDCARSRRSPADLAASPGNARNPAAPQRNIPLIRL